MGESNGKGCMDTYKGHRFYPHEPDTLTPDIEDIAHALSMLCRYGGHGIGFYSVAEHCVLLADYALGSLEAYTPAESRWDITKRLMLHDASEAYLVDLPRSVKAVLPDYQNLETALTNKINKSFGIKPDIQRDWVVACMDKRIVEDEMTVLFPTLRHDWPIPSGGALGVQLKLWSPQAAEHMFLDMWGRIYDPKIDHE